MKRFASFRLDTANECVWQAETRIVLPPKPFAVLRYLVEHPGRLVTHDELLDALWPDTYVQPQVLRTYVLDLRKALGDDAAHPRFIETLPKRGYCFLSPVSEDPAPASAPLQNPGTRRFPLARGCRQPCAIVGRDAELAQLAESIEHLSVSGRQVVFLSGEAGIGKSALADVFCAQLRTSPPIQIAQAQCIEGFGTREQYYPVMEMLRELCAGLEGRAALDTLSRKAPDWLHALFPGAAATPADTHLSSLPPSASGVAPDERSLESLCAALEELSRDIPLVLVFEDLQWADSGTLHLLSALARRQAQARLMLLLTCRRDGASDQLSSLRQDLKIRRRAREIELGPLSRPAVAELMRSALDGQSFPPGLDTFVYRRSEGNPLFVIALVEHLVAQHFLTLGRDGWEQRTPLDDQASVPEGLAQMIELEIDSLPLQEQEVLECGSLTNVVFPAWAVAAALAENPARIEEVCDRLSRRPRFIRRCGEDELPDGTHSSFYVFAHQLYREVLYSRQSAARRAERHIRIAERLRDLFIDREASVAREMAMHYQAAGSRRKAVDTWRLAALDAHRRQAYAEAAELLTRALRIAETMPGEEGQETLSRIQDELATAVALLPASTRPSTQKA